METLQVSPPKSLQQLYSVLTEEVRVIRQQLASLEKEFYSQGCDATNAHQFISRWAPVAREVIQCHSLAELNSLRQMQSAIVLGRDPELLELQPNLKRISRETCLQLAHLQSLLLTYVPSRFTCMVEAAGKVQVLCDKFLLSFYSLDSRQALVETAKKYTINRRAWNGRVRECLKNVLFNPHMFQRDCLRLSRMEKATLDMLNRADIVAAPVVGLFTDECEQMRAALDTLDEWISHDQGYSSFIATDLAEMEKRRSELTAQLKIQRHQLNTVQYRKKILQAEKAKLQVELTSLADKEEELLLAEEQLYQDVNNAKIKCEIKGFRREEIKRAARQRRAANPPSDFDEADDLLDPDEANMLLKQLKEQLRILRHSIPQMERKMLAMRSKLVVIEEKQRRFYETSESLRQTEQEALQLKKDVGDASYALQQCETCLEKCVQIHKLKTSSDTLHKVFHDLQLETKAVQEATTQRMLQQTQLSTVPPAAGGLSPRGGGGGGSGSGVDSSASTGHIRGTVGNTNNSSSSHSSCLPLIATEGTPFDKMSLLVAQRIERDWKRLYRALPFVPQRGRETIDKDIEELQGNFIGESLFQCAWRAVQRWRRFHRRAKLAELRAALGRVRRGDLVAEIDTFLTPPTIAVVKETPLPANIDKDLVPFYRQIERYDNMVQMRQSKETVK